MQQRGPQTTESAAAEPVASSSSFRAEWTKAVRRVGPWVVGAVILIAAGLSIFEGLTFLTILDRSLLFINAALVVVVVILVLMFFAKSAELNGTLRRLSATTQAKDRFEKEALKVLELEQKVKTLEETLTESTMKAEAASAEVVRLTAEGAKLASHAAEVETNVAALRAERGELKDRLELAGKQLGKLEIEKTTLAVLVASLESEKKRLLAGQDALEKGASKLQEQLQAREREIQQLDREVTKAQSSNQRAQFIPSIDLECGTLGFGVLSAKRVFADVKNLGPGVAQDVSLSIADGTVSQPTRYSPVGYWTALGPSEAQRVIVGDTNSLPASIRCRVTFSSQFGPCEPAELVYTP